MAVNLIPSICFQLIWSQGKVHTEVYTNYSTYVVIAWSSPLPCYFVSPHLYQAFTNFPTENARVILFVIFNPVLNLRCCHTRLRASDDSWSDRASLLISIEDFGNTSMAHTKLPRDNTRSDASGRHFNDLESDVVRQRSAIYKHTSQLIDSALTWKRKNMIDIHFDFVHIIATLNWFPDFNGLNLNLTKCRR